MVPDDPAPTGLLRSAARLERVGVLLLLAVALVPRLRDVATPFDREAEGAQAAFFAIAAVNHERLGLSRTGGYPVLNVDATSPDLRGAGAPISSRHWLFYTNHPPLVPLVAWAALEALAPRGWDAAWREHRAPAGIELPLRLPFLAAHLLFLWSLWWAARQSAGPRAALIALGLAASTPVLVHYATLVNYENPALVAVVLAAGFHARWLRDGRASDLLGFALCFLAGSCVTWAGLFFLPWFVLAAWAGGRFRRGALEALWGGAAAALPLVGHTLWARRVAGLAGLGLEGPVERARVLLQPLLDGSVGLDTWALRQLERLGPWLGWPLAVLALAGLGVALARLAQPPPGRARHPWRVETGVPLLLGGWSYLLAFYRHTLDPQHSFLMLVAPGFVLLAAGALDALAGPLLRLRAGLAPLVLVASSVAVVGIDSANRLRHAHRATAEQAARHHLPAPALPLPDETGAELAELVPPGALGLYPATTGLNLAVHFYAWRSLLPLAAADDLGYEAVARAAGLEHAPRVLLLPTPPPPEAEELSETLRAALAPPGAELRAGQRWAALPLD